MDSYRKTDREREMKDKERLTYSYRDTVPVRDTEDILERQLLREKDRQTVIQRWTDRLLCRETDKDLYMEKERLLYRETKRDLYL